MQVTPINDAEAILSPWWDSPLSDLAEWRVTPGVAHGLEVKQNWCWVSFSWTRSPATGPALEMQRTCDVPCHLYDRLVLSVMAPPGTVVRLSATTDVGRCQLVAPPAGDKKAELVLDLQGATQIHTVTIAMDAAGPGPANGWLNWLGLQHSGALARKLHTPVVGNTHWEKYLKEEHAPLTFAPSYGLVLNTAELDALRARREHLLAAGSSCPFTAAAEAARATPPESMIHDYVNFWGDSRYNRERDHGKYILNHGLNAAVAGHLLRDPSLLRLAARYALSIGMCRHWDDGFICRFPGSTFDHRCFVQSLCAHEVAGILDLAGECFTWQGREFLLRRLAEEAVGAINFNTWKYDYIFTCNQLSWFTPGRMLALAVLNKHWPRVRPQLDIAYRDLCDSLERTILPDGGYVEGPTYFRCVGRDAGLGVYYYSRALGQPLAELLPAAMRRCGDFGALIASTAAQYDVIPFCDAGNRLEVIAQAIMAGLLPASAWLNMLRKSVARTQGWPVSTLHVGVSMMADSAIAWNLLEQLPATAPAPAALVCLPQMGPIASHRQHGPHAVKLFIQGNLAGAGHTHEDKGSFVLEYAGDTFALDPGTCDYSHPLARTLQLCERHNMLVPTGLEVRPAPACPLPVDVKPIAHGDATAFHAELDATPGWAPYYRRWHRTWDSPTPDRLTITDVYELASGTGVEWYWQTRLPVTLDGARAVLIGTHGQALLTAPAGTTWRLDELPLLEGVQRRLVLALPARSGTLTVTVQLAPR